MIESVIRSENLCRDFGKKRAIDDVSFEIARGSVCSLLGPNGAGKTTLLKLLHGLILPTAGQCSIVGDRKFPRDARTMQSVGCVLDEFEPPRSAKLKQLLSLSRSIGPNFDERRAKQLLDEIKDKNAGLYWHLCCAVDARCYCSMNRLTDLTQHLARSSIS